MRNNLSLLKGTPYQTIREGRFDQIQGSEDQEDRSDPLHYLILPATTCKGAFLLADIKAVKDPSVLSQYGIKTVITAASELGHLKISSELTHVVFPILQTHSDDIDNFFELSNATIEQSLKRGGVAIHCGAGISRSATLIVAYFMKSEQLTLTKSIAKLNKVKRSFCPSEYLASLQRYNSKLFPEPKCGQKQTSKTVAVVNVLEKFPQQSEHHLTHKGFSHGKVTKFKSKQTPSQKEQVQDFRNEEFVVSGSELKLETNQVGSQSWEDSKGQESYDPSKYSRSGDNGWHTVNITSGKIKDRITVTKDPKLIELLD